MYPRSVPERRFRLSDMELDFVSLVAAGDDPEAQVVIAKTAPEDKSADHSGGSSTLPDNDTLEDSMAGINKADLAPEVAAYIEGLESEVDTLSEQVEKSEADLEAKNAELDAAKDRLSKSAPIDSEAAEKEMLEKADPALRSFIEKAQKDAKEAQEVAKAEREARLEREFIAKAETLPMIAEDKATLAGLLRKISDALDPEDAQAVETVLKSANEQIRQSNLFTTFGKSGQETTVSKSVKSLVSELRKQDPSLTPEQAEAKVYDENPDLLAQALTEQEG